MHAYVMVLVHYLAHERSRDGSCECDTIEIVLFGFFEPLCVLCNWYMGQLFTSSIAILSVRGTYLAL